VVVFQRLVVFTAAQDLLGRSKRKQPTTHDIISPAEPQPCSCCSSRSAPSSTQSPAAGCWHLMNATRGVCCQPEAPGSYASTLRRLHCCCARCAGLCYSKGSAVAGKAVKLAVCLLLDGCSNSAAATMLKKYIPKF
jgi:hypothetical protein